MNQPAETPEPEKRSWQSAAVTVAALTLLAVVLLLPGVIAGILSLSTNKAENFRMYDPALHSYGWPVQKSAWDYYFYPATKLTGIPPIAYLYEWEYSHAGGRRFSSSTTILPDLKLLDASPTPAP